MARPRTLRARLALLFGFTSTVLAAGFGTLLVHQARLQLAHAIDEGIVPVATELAVRVAAEGPGVIAGPAPELRPPSDAIAQVVDGSGRILASSTFLGNTRPLLKPADAATVAGGERRMRRQATIEGPDGGAEPARLLAFRVTTGGRS